MEIDERLALLEQSLRRLELAPQRMLLGRGARQKRERARPEARGRLRRKKSGQALRARPCQEAVEAAVVISA